MSKITLREIELVGEDIRTNNLLKELEGMIYDAKMKETLDLLLNKREQVLKERQLILTELNLIIKRGER